MKKEKIRIFILCFFLIILSSLWLNYASKTNNFFSIDDFAVLSYFKSHGVFQMVPDFLLHSDIFGYRKIVGFVVFGALFKNFGANPTPFILAMFIVQTINLLLLFFIARKLSGNDIVSFFVSVIFNKFYLFYFSNIHEVIAAMFCLLTLYLFLRFPKKKFLPIPFYILALFSKELAFSLPFVIWSILKIRREDTRRAIPFFVVLACWGLYQAYFLFILGSRSFVSVYGVTLDPGNFAEMILFYFSPYLIAVLLFLPLIGRKYDLYYLLLFSFITISPVLFFGARREFYYIYIPAVYLMIYVALCLPRLNFKSSLVYLVLLLVFGGRSILPILARKDFPNWQKVSVENVVRKVESGLENRPKSALISLSDINLERDAVLMLSSGDLDLFVDKKLSRDYNFKYNAEDKSVMAVLKTD